MQKFTHSDLLDITEKENKLKALFGQHTGEEIHSPKKETISNILNYSKALSVRKSRNLDFIELVLN